MTDTEFLDAAEQLLLLVEQACDRINDEGLADIDCQRSGGGVITLTFAGGGQIVINLQKPLHEIWLASRNGGYHYRCDQGRWLDSRHGGRDFFSQLETDASQMAGCALRFRV